MDEEEETYDDTITDCYKELNKMKPIGNYANDLQKDIETK